MKKKKRWGKTRLVKEAFLAINGCQDCDNKNSNEIVITWSKKDNDNYKLRCKKCGWQTKGRVF